MNLQRQSSEKGAPAVPFASYNTGPPGIAFGLVMHISALAKTSCVVKSKQHKAERSKPEEHKSEISCFRMPCRES